MRAGERCSETLISGISGGFRHERRFTSVSKAFQAVTETAWNRCEKGPYRSRKGPYRGHKAEGACWTTALALVPPFLGRLCAWGMFLGRPAAGGCSSDALPQGDALLSAQSRSVRQASRKRSGPAAHFLRGSVAQSFLFCTRGGWQRHNPDEWSCYGLSPSSADGLAWTCAVVPSYSTLQHVLGNRGTHAVPPAGTKGSLHPPLGDG